METKLNIVEILKDKPKGIKLYSPLFGDVHFSDINNSTTYVSHHNSIVSFYKDASYFKLEEAEPLLFPSKEMRDWSKFAWKKGDVLVSEKDYKSHIIFDKFNDDTYTTFTGKCYFKATRLGFNYIPICNTVPTEDFDKEKNDTDKTYTNIIGKKLGGKLNLETLEIENTQPEFKDGDIVFADYGFKQAVFIVSGKTDLSEGYNSFIALDLRGILDMGCRMSFVKKDICRLRFATEEEKQQLFSALAKENKAWDAEKKEIVDLKIKWTPKTFDRVITRDFDDGVWSANIFSHMNSQGEYVSIGCVEGYAYCLPYNEETAKLIGTTNNAK